MGKQINIFGELEEPPTFFDANYDNIKKGFEGENDIREFLKRKSITISVGMSQYVLFVM